MYLSQVDIQNFRFGPLHDFQPGVNFLIGRNDSGKTNLLQAIRPGTWIERFTRRCSWFEQDHFHKASATYDVDGGQQFVTA